MSHATDREKIKRERRIADMSTTQILWHVAYKHRVFLLILSNATTLTIWVARTSFHA